MRRVIFVVIFLLGLAPSVGFAAAGNQAEPIPLKSMATVGDAWQITVAKVYTDPAKIDPKATWFLDWLKTSPQPAGQAILAMKVHLKNVGPKAGYVSDVQFDLINATGFVYDSCGNPPGAVEPFRQLDVNDAVDAVICFTIKTTDANSVLLRAEPEFTFDDSTAVWFAVSKTAAAKAVPTSAPTSIAAAADINAPGCEGLADYRTAMFAVGRAYVSVLKKDGVGAGTDPFAYSSDDWLTLSNDAADYQRALKSVTPPDWAKAWHQTRIALMGLGQQISIAAANGGIMATIPFKDSEDKIDAETKTALAAAIATCGAFQQFQSDYDALDGFNTDGTPVPTPAN